MYRAYSANQAIPAVLSRKDGRIVKSAISQRQQVSLAGFFSRYMLNAKEAICKYPFLSPEL